jgi:hypothetical protein
MDWLTGEASLTPRLVFATLAAGYLIFFYFQRRRQFQVRD